MKPIVEAEFWEWIHNDARFSAIEFGLKERYADAIGQRIKEINWQYAKIDEASKKILNMLKDPLGKAMLCYLSENDADFKEAIAGAKDGR